MGFLLGALNRGVRRRHRLQREFIMDAKLIDKRIAQQLVIINQQDFLDAVHHSLARSSACRRVIAPNQYGLKFIVHTTFR